MGGREQGRAITVSLAAPHHDLPAFEVDVLHPEGQNFEEAEAAAVEELADQAERWLQVIEKIEDLPAGEHGGEVSRAAGALEPAEIGHR